MNQELLFLAIVFCAAAGLAVFLRILRQPAVIAYLAAGAILGHFGLIDSTDHNSFRIFSDLGVMFLLFLIGMEINYSAVRLVGGTALILGIGQIIFTSLFGYLIALLLGFNHLPALYISVALTFSSTVIIVKLLSEKKDLGSLYGKISIGMMLVQDIAAILILVGLAGIEAGRGFELSSVGAIILKAIALFALMFWAGKRILPSVFDKVAKSEEILFLVSTAWVLIIAAAVQRIGFSIEIGGFVAGLALAQSAEHFQIASRIKPLRDFFILLFFVILGSSLALSQVGEVIFPAVVLSLFVLIGNPLIVLVIMGILGYRRRTAFLTGLTVAQISEFSLILAVLGERLGHISSYTVSLITAVGAITITLSTYMIMYAEKIFPFIAPYLRLFERRYTFEGESNFSKTPKPIILIGAHRTGRHIIEYFSPKDVLVVDFNPDVINQLRQQGYECLFGDITDRDILFEAGLGKARLIISTSPDLETNLALLEQVQRLRKYSKKRDESINDVKVIVKAEDDQEALELYKSGADYVILPHSLSGHYIGKLLSENDLTRVLNSLRDKDISALEKFGVIG